MRWGSKDMGLFYKKLWRWIGLPNQVHPSHFLCDYLSSRFQMKTLNILSLMFFSNLFESMGNSAMFGYLPKLLQRFGVAPRDIGYIVGQIQAVYFVGCCFFLLLYTKVATKFSARKSFIIISIFEALAFLFVAFSNSVPWIFVGALIISVPVTKSALCL